MLNSTSLRCSLACVLAAGLASAQSTIEPYGTGTPGTGNKTPELWPTTTPRLGERNFGLRIENGLPNALAITFASAQPATPAPRGLAVLIDLGQLIYGIGWTTLDANGSVVQRLPIPNHKNLKGLTVYGQSFVIDPGGAKIGLSSTRGLRVTMGQSPLLLTWRQAIDLQTGKIQAMTRTGQLDVFDGQVAFLKGRTRAVTVSSTAGSPTPFPWNNAIALYDVTNPAPSFVSSFKTQAITGGLNLVPWAVAPTPDGSRIYVVNQGQVGTKPTIQVFWGDPSKPTFGREITNARITLPYNSGVLDLKFTSDGKIGVLGNLGLGLPHLTFYDTDPTSRTYQQVLRTTRLPNLMSSFVILKGDKRIVAVHSVGQRGVASLIDVATGKIIDANPKTSAVDPVGLLNGSASGAVVGPRGKYLYLGAFDWSSTPRRGEVRRYVIDPQDPNYLSMTLAKVGSGAQLGIVALAISDAGDKLYAADSGNHLSEIFELDAASFKVLRTFKNPGNAPWVGSWLTVR